MSFIWYGLHYPGGPQLQGHWAPRSPRPWAQHCLALLTCHILKQTSLTSSCFRVVFLLFFIYAQATFPEGGYFSEEKCSSYFIAWTLGQLSAQWLQHELFFFQEQGHGLLVDIVTRDISEKKTMTKSHHVFLFVWWTRIQTKTSLSKTFPSAL